MPSHPAAVKQNKPFKPYSHCFKRGRCVEFALPDFRVLVGWPSGLRRTPGKCVYVNSVPRVQIPISPPFTYPTKSQEVRKAQYLLGFFMPKRPLLSCSIRCNPRKSWVTFWVTCAFG